MTPRSRLAACVILPAALLSWAAAVYAQSDHSLLLLLSHHRATAFSATTWEHLTTTQWQNITNTWN